MKKILLIAGFCVAAILVSCQQKQRTMPPMVASSPVEIDSLPGSSPSLTKDQKGNTVLSWVRLLNDSAAIFCYSVICERPGTTVEIPSTRNIYPHSENLPKVIFKPFGEIIAVWGVRHPNPQNRHSGLIFYSQSFDEGRTWTEGKKLVEDTAGYDQRYSDVSLLQNGEVGIIWLDNRKTDDSEGSALYWSVTDGDNGFQEGRLISEPACQCCRTKLFVDSRNNIHAVYRGILNDSIRDMVHVVSKDGGNTFTPAKQIHYDNWVLRACPHTGPAMTENSEGLHFAWFTGGVAKGSYYIRSADNGESFNSHDSISRLGTHPQLSALPEGQLVIVWDESTQKGDEYFKRIGMQVRTAEGLTSVTGFITPDTAHSTYPVISPVDDRSVVVAYSSKENNKPYVKYQQVRLQL